MENQILIEARELSRRYGATMAVSGLNLTLRKGEILGLLGPNGAGKSTLLKAVSGLLPRTGSIRFAGKDMSKAARATR